MYADNLVLCDETEEDLGPIVGRVFEVCNRRSGLKVNTGKNEMMVLNGEEIFECEVSVEEVRLD